MDVKGTAASGGGRKTFKERGIVVIGISGKIGSGKDYVKNFLGEYMDDLKKRWVAVAFAFPLKFQVATRLGVSIDALNDRKDAESRALIQAEGRHMRERDGSDAVVKHFVPMAELMVQINEARVLIVPDVRFPREVDWVRREGGIVIRLEAPSRTRAKLAAECNDDEAAMLRNGAETSETALDDVCFEFTLNNDPGNEHRFNERLNLIVQFLLK